MASAAVVKVQKKLSLTRQQFRAADLWIRGKSFSEIAVDLATSPETVAVWLREYRTDLAQRMADNLDNLSAERQDSIRNLIKHAWVIFNEDQTPKNLKMIRDLEMDLAKLQGVLVDKSIILSKRAKEEPEKRYIGFEDKLPDDDTVIEAAAKAVT